VQILGLGSGAEVATDSVGMHCPRAFKIELFGQKAGVEKRTRRRRRSGRFLPAVGSEDGIRTGLDV
jgi:hypothetical protein